MALPKPDTQIETTIIAETDLNLADALGRVRRHEARIVVADSDGEPAGAIVSLDDLRDLRELDRRRAWQQLLAVMDTMAAGFADLSTEEIEQLVAEEIAADKAERRAARSQE